MSEGCAAIQPRAGAEQARAGAGRAGREEDMRVSRRVAAGAVALSALLLTGTTVVSAQVGSPDRANQEYVWISNYANLPLFVERVYPALDQFAGEYGVTVRKAGPTGFDLAAYIATVEQECAKSLAGVIVVGGWDPSLTEPVNKCIDARVPTAVTDGDLFQSRRLVYVGTDWYQLGCRMAERQIAEHQAKGLTTGQVGVISPIQNENMARSRDCIRTTLEAAGIQVVAEEDNESAADIAAQKTAAIIAANPDLTGMIGLDSEAGPGIVTAVNEAQKAGQLILTTNEAGREYLQNVKDGVVSMVTMENYDVMNYTALFMLYTFHNDSIRVAGIDPWEQNWMPQSIDSGLLLVDAANVDQVMQFMEEAERQSGG
jgi:ABC-type sugar transport system substrate-binding protein